MSVLHKSMAAGSYGVDFDWHLPHFGKSADAGSRDGFGAVLRPEQSAASCSRRLRVPTLATAIIIPDLTMEPTSGPYYGSDHTPDDRPYYRPYPVYREATTGPTGLTIAPTIGLTPPITAIMDIAAWNAATITERTYG
ncbi:hypothetical protein [Rhizobium yanglingense]